VGGVTEEGIEEENCQMMPIKFAMGTFGVMVLSLIAFFMIRGKEEELRKEIRTTNNEATVSYSSLVDFQGIPEPLHGYYPEEPEELPPRAERVQCAPSTCSLSQINFW